GPGACAFSGLASSRGESNRADRGRSQRGEEPMLSTTTNPTNNGAAPLRTNPPVPVDETGDETYPQTTMRVRKRNGSTEPVDLDKIVRAVSRCCTGLPNVD